MIIDQGCQTNAPTAKLFVSSEPEYWCNDVPLNEDDLRGLCEEYRAFCEKLCRCAGIVDFSRFRVYGEIRQDGQHVMVLVTEFKEWKDDHAYWSCIEDVRAETHAHLWIMDDSTEVDRTRSIDGEWRDGPDHGREFYQVELSWRIEKLSYQNIQALLERVSNATSSVWMTGGIGVC